MIEKVYVGLLGVFFAWVLTTLVDSMQLERVQVDNLIERVTRLEEACTKKGPEGP